MGVCVCVCVCSGLGRVCDIYDIDETLYPTTEKDFSCKRVVAPMIIGKFYFKLKLTCIYHRIIYPCIKYEFSTIIFSKDKRKPVFKQKLS